MIKARTPGSSGGQESRWAGQTLQAFRTLGRNKLLKRFAKQAGTPGGAQRRNTMAKNARPDRALPDNSKNTKGRQAMAQAQTDDIGIKHTTYAGGEKEIKKAGGKTLSPGNLTFGKKKSAKWKT